MTERTYYKAGDYYRICDRTGFKVRNSKSKKEWNNLIVRKRSWEARHPQDFVRGIPDYQAVPEPRPRACDDVFISIGSAGGNGGNAGAYGIEALAGAGGAGGSIGAPGSDGKPYGGGGGGGGSASGGYCGTGGNAGGLGAQGAEGIIYIEYRTKIPIPAVAIDPPPPPLPDEVPPPALLCLPAVFLSAPVDE